MWTTFPLDLRISPSLLSFKSASKELLKCAFNLRPHSVVFTVYSLYVHVLCKNTVFLCANCICYCIIYIHIWHIHILRTIWEQTNNVLHVYVYIFICIYSMHRYIYVYIWHIYTVYMCVYVCVPNVFKTNFIMPFAEPPVVSSGSHGDGVAFSRNFRSLSVSLGQNWKKKTNTKLKNKPGFSSGVFLSLSLFQTLCLFH